MIQWFPGHMHKARKEMAEVLPHVDAVIEVLDARIPYSSENPMLRTLAADKPRLSLLTRRDLADPALTTRWVARFEAAGQAAMAVDLAGDDSRPPVTDALTRVLGRQARRSRPAVALVAGIPNVGKSTLINRLAGRSIARTGNEPAVTKRQQTIRLDDHWVLHDTPGVLWPRVDNRASGYRLAATGAIRDTAIDSSDVAVFLLDTLREQHAERLTARYGDTLPMDDAVALLEAIGRHRGCLGAGGLVDFDRAARLLLQEFRAGTLGPVTLETPAMRDVEERLVRETLAARDAERTSRRQARQARRRQRRSS